MAHRPEDILKLIQIADQLNAEARLDIFEFLSASFSLIPLVGGFPAPGQPSREFKRPTESNWQQWCEQKRPFNRKDFAPERAGVACGPASGVLVLDVDDMLLTSNPFGPNSSSKLKRRSKWCPDSLVNPTKRANNCCGLMSRAELSRLKGPLSSASLSIIPLYFSKKPGKLPGILAIVSSTLSFMVAERDDSLRKYRIRTLLTMDMAYIDARLICRPDTEWLNP